MPESSPSGRRGAGLWLACLKAGVAASILVWMVHTGKLDPSHVAGAVKRWPELALIAALLYLQIGLTAWRWNLLLAAQSVALTFREAFSLTMIGVLFTTVMPGAVGGDIVKAYYVSRRAEHHKPQAVATILVDRLIGLLGILSFAASASAWNFGLVRTSSALAALCGIVTVAALSFSLLLFGAVAASHRVLSVISTLQHAVPLSVPLSRAVEALVEFKRQPRVLLAALGLSWPCNLLSCLGFYFAARALGDSSVSLPYFFFVVPLGLAAATLPLSPGGLGVGQAAFGALFAILPGGGAALGANSCTVFQFVLLLVYSSGAWFYLSYKRAASRETPSEPVDGQESCHN